jgi:ribosomal protein L22
MVESAGVPRPNNGAVHKAGSSKRVLKFCCACLKMQKVAELKGLDEDSLVIELIQVSKAPKMHCCTYRAHSLSDPF